MAEIKLTGNGEAAGRPLSTGEALAQAEAAAALVMRGRNALRKMELDAARQFLKEAFALAPRDEGALELLGDVYMAEGETARAATLFEKALTLYPKHPVFEEKLAVCHLDMAQMESDKLTRERLLSGEDLGEIFDRSPARATTLSLFVPGAGQFYNEEEEKAYILAGVAAVSFLAWFYPLITAWSDLPKTIKVVNNVPNLDATFQNMSGFQSALFGLGLLIWVGVYVFSVVDAGQTARADNEERRRGLGL